MVDCIYNRKVLIKIVFRFEEKKVIHISDLWNDFIRKCHIK